MALSKEEKELRAKRFTMALAEGKSQKRAFMEAHPDRLPPTGGGEIKKFYMTPEVQKELAMIRQQFKQKVIKLMPQALDRVEAIGGGQMVITQRDNKGKVIGRRYQDHDSPDAALRANKAIIEMGEGKIGRQPMRVEGDVNIYAPVTLSFIKEAQRQLHEERIAEMREVIEAEVKDSEEEETTD